jgi:eukaryotic-like serine/threonine-protein kinase
MGPRRTYDLKQIFTEAVELTGESRQRYLDEACAGDLSVRREVEALLAEADADEDILGWKSVGELLFAGAKDPSVFGAGDLISDSFRIVRLIGSGGMGEVYEAEDLRLGGRVAIKTLRSRFLALPGFTARFRREIQLARRVTHRNVCRIYDLGRDRVKGEDVVFLTMELLPGETLAEYIKRGPLPADEVKGLAQQIGSGLAALHAADIVHRDVKPSNILIEGAGPTRRLVITDFGLAHPMSFDDAGENLSQSGEFLGTPAYAAPEQLTGKKIGPSADIYSLGLVMYEMLTGRKPFEGGNAFDIAAQKLTGKAPPPSKYARISPAWDTVVLRCLECDVWRQTQQIDLQIRSNC